jgi:hypothetical protein
MSAVWPLHALRHQNDPVQFPDILEVKRSVDFTEYGNTRQTEIGIIGDAHAWHKPLASFNTWVLRHRACRQVVWKQNYRELQSIAEPSTDCDR